MKFIVDTKKFNITILDDIIDLTQLANISAVLKYPEHYTYEQGIKDDSAIKPEPKINGRPISQILDEIKKSRENNERRKKEFIDKVIAKFKVRPTEENDYWNNVELPYRWGCDFNDIYLGHAKPDWFKEVDYTKVPEEYFNKLKVETADTEM